MTKEEKLISELFCKGKTNVEIQKEYEKRFKAITPQGIRFKLIKIFGERVYKAVKKAYIKHPHMRKYYKRK